MNLIVNMLYICYHETNLFSYAYLCSGKGFCPWASCMRHIMSSNVNDNNGNNSFNNIVNGTYSGLLFA